MKRIALLPALATLLLMAGLALAQTPPGRTAAQTQIMANEKAVMDAFAKNDPTTFHSLVASDSFALGEMGLGRVADLDQIMSACKYVSWGLNGSQFYWINDATAVHIFKSTGKGTCQGQPVPEATWSSTVWTNKGGKWVAVFHQESIAIQQPAPPAKK
jgi:hypothetical protein